MKKRVGILISGRGSNMRSLIAAAAAPDFPAEIVLVISNAVNAEGLQHAAAAGIATQVISHKPYETREAFDAAVSASLEAAAVDIVCLAGFMRILSSWFTRYWEGRLVNIHPSLLPLFKGVHVHEQVLQAGVRISGCTDTPATLGARVLVEEHKLYPAALKVLAEDRVRLENGRAVFTRL